VVFEHLAVVDEPARQRLRVERVIFFKAVRRDGTEDERQRYLNKESPASARKLFNKVELAQKQLSSPSRT